MLTESLIRAIFSAAFPILRYSIAHDFGSTNADRTVSYAY